VPIDPFHDRSLRAAQEIWEREEKLRRLAEDPAVRAARELYDSPASRALREVTDSPTMRAIHDLDNSPTIRALREAQEREDAIRKLTEGPYEQAIRDARKATDVLGLEEKSRAFEEASGRASSRALRDAADAGSALAERALSAAIWSAHTGAGALPRRKSEELQQLADEAGRAKEVVGRQIEEIAEDADGEAREELESLRKTLASQERQGRNAARLERRKERKAEAEYWFRQWMNSLAIGNGAGFLSVTSGLLQANRLELALTLVYAPLTYFALGLLAAGMLRMLVWGIHVSPSGSRRQRISTNAVIFATVASASFFVLGLGSAVWQVTQFNPVAGKIAARTAAVAAKELQVRELEVNEKLKGLTAAKARPAPPQSPAKADAPPAR
jgi:hypothetical protein